LFARLESKGGAAAAAVLVVLVLVLLSSSLIGGKVFGSGDLIFQWQPFAAQRAAVGWSRPSNFILTDPELVFDPHRLQDRVNLRNGTLPLWNPLAGAGRPMLGSAEDAVLFPLTWLLFLFPYFSTLGWIAAAKLLIGGAGAYLFCRDQTLRRGPSLLASIAFVFGTYYVAWLEHPHTNVWSMLPWMFLAARRVCARGSLLATAALGAFTGLAWLGEHPETSAFLVGATAAYGAFLLLAEKARGPDVEPREQEWSGPEWTHGLRQRAGLVAAGLLLGTGIGAVMLIPLFELTGLVASTNRGGPGYALKGGWAFFFPEMWGLPNKAFSVAGPVENFNERTAYIGALPLLLAVGGLGRRRPREQWFFAGLAVLLLATIYDTPIWANAVRSLPGGKVALLGRMLIIVSFAGGVLAAYGLQYWLDGTKAQRRRMLWKMAAIAVIPAVLWLVPHLGTLSTLPTALRQLPAVHNSVHSIHVVELASVWRWVLICALGIAALALVRRRAVVIVLVILLTSVDLLSLDRGYHASISVAQANPPVPETVRYLQAHEGTSRMIASQFALPANLAERYGLRDPRVRDVLLPARYLSLWLGLGGTGNVEQFFDASAPDAQRLANVFAARYVLLSPTQPASRWLRPVLRTPGGTVAINPTAFPRAWIAYSWRTAHGSSDDLATTLASPGSELERSPVIEGVAPPAASGGSAPGNAQITEDGPQTVSISATASRPGYLILDDSAYPGWTASVDGHSVAWHPANENFRAVAIPAGRHTVTFRYRPGSVLRGVIISVICALILIALTIFGTLIRRRARTADG
jgi:hypothetical protein